MRILQFGRNFPPHIGGTENVMHDLFTGINEVEGHFADVLCIGDSNQFLKEEGENGTVFRTPRILSFGSISISPQQFFLFRDIVSNYDIVHLHHPAPMATISLLAGLGRAKLVVTWHSDIVRQKMLLKVYEPLQESMLRKACVIVATTECYRQGSSFLRGFQDKTKVIPIGINALTNRINFDSLSRLKKIYKGKKVVFSLGRLVGYKGYEHLINAAKYVSDDVKIVIGGDGPLRGVLQNLIEREAVSNIVELIGRIDDRDVPSYFEACDVFCLPSVSKNEAFGVVLLEAMSLGKPIVATNIPESGVSWVNKHGETGLNVGVGSPREIGSAIMNLLNNKDLRQDFSEGAKKRFEKYFTKDSMVKSYIQLYKDILA
jgi:glycosyltransferase involved in cell wall biosynthesis